MSDGRKNNGGKREGAGRKTKAEEMGLPQLIEEVIGDEGKKKLVKTLYDNAVVSKDIKAITLLMSYIYGKPSDSGILPVDKEDIQSITINYIKPDGDKD